MSLEQEKEQFVPFPKMEPEGIVVFHVAANLCFKKTVEKDEESKDHAARKAAYLARRGE